jgi:hypothetical protein
MVQAFCLICFFTMLMVWIPTLWNFSFYSVSKKMAWLITFLHYLTSIILKEKVGFILIPSNLEESAILFFCKMIQVIEWWVLFFMLMSKYVNQIILNWDENWNSHVGKPSTAAGLIIVICLKPWYIYVTYIYSTCIYDMFLIDYGFPSYDI